MRVFVLIHAVTTPLLSIFRARREPWRSSNTAGEVSRQLLAPEASSLGDQDHWNLVSIPLATALISPRQTQLEPEALNIHTPRSVSRTLKSPSFASDHALGAGIVPIHLVFAVACQILFFSYHSYSYILVLIPILLLTPRSFLLPY